MDAGVLQVTSPPCHDGTVVVRVQAVGELDLANAMLLRQTLTAAISRQPSLVDVDLTGVTFFDCAALRALEHAERIAGGRLRLVATSKAVRLVLTVLGMQHHFRTG